jgi:DNA-binding transcriptional MerR regulator
MDIGELARQSGSAPSALRFYEEKGLIRSSGRHGLRRQYEPEVLDQVGLITLGRSAGLTLDEIGRMLTVGGRAEVDRQLLADRADAIDEQIRKLTTIREGLRHAAACHAPDHMACPKFRRLMGLAVRKAIVTAKPSPRRQLQPSGRGGGA